MKYTKDYTPEVIEYALFSDGIGTYDSRTFQPRILGRRSVALLLHSCDIFGIDWSSEVHKLDCHCYLQGFPHTQEKFHRALAQQMLNGGANSVAINLYKSISSNWVCFDTFAYFPREVRRHAA